MRKLTFDTPIESREPRPVPVDLCGETLTVQRPKDAVIFFAQRVAGGSVTEPDQALAVLEFVEGTFEAKDRQRFFERICTFDDPVDLTACMTMLTGLLDRWGNYPEQEDPDTVVVESSYTPPVGREQHLDLPDIGIDMVAHPPKDIVLLFTSASMATGVNVGQQAWLVSLFLDAALKPADAWTVARRLRNRGDDLDLSHVAKIVQELIDGWRPGLNREQRRAAGRA